MIGTWALSRVGESADGGGGLEAVHARHLDVHDNRVESLSAGQVQGQQSVGGHLDLVATLLEQHRDELPVGGRVFGQQDAKRLVGRRDGVQGAADPGSNRRGRRIGVDGGGGGRRKSSREASRRRLALVR